MTRRPLRWQSGSGGCVRYWTLRCSAPVRCGDVEIRCFGTGLELHPVRRAFPDRLRLVEVAVRKQRFRSVWKGGGHSVRVSACSGGKLGFIEISQVAWSFGSVSRTASAVRRSRRFGIVIGSEQAAFRRGRLGAGSPYGQLISTLLVYSDWNSGFGSWKGKKHAVRFGGSVVGQKTSFRFRSAVSDARYFGAGLSTRESRLRAGFRRTAKLARGDVSASHQRGSRRLRPVRALGSRHLRVARRAELARFEVSQLLSWKIRLSASVGE